MGNKCIVTLSWYAGDDAGPEDHDTKNTQWLEDNHDDSGGDKRTMPMAIAMIMLMVMAPRI